MTQQTAGITRKAENDHRNTRNRTWSHHWFYNNPTFATLTILNKFELDSRRATLFVLRDVADYLDKQHAR